MQQRDGRVALTALAPLGQLWPALLRALARACDDVRLSTRRTVTLVDLDPAAVDRTRAALGAARLVMQGDSGWVGLTACAGTGGCPRALGDVRAAGRRAAVRLAKDPAEHWAACERRCGEVPGTPVGRRPRRGRRRAARRLPDAARRLARAGRADAGRGGVVIAYERDGAAIYRRSFVIIRAEADLGGLI